MSPTLRKPLGHITIIFICVGFAFRQLGQRGNYQTEGSNIKNERWNIPGLQTHGRIVSSLAC